MNHLATRQRSMENRRLVRSGTNELHWRTEFLVPEIDSPSESDFDPQAFLIEMTPQEVIMPHFHEVEQFQVFIEGGGQLGRSKPVSKPVVVHYTDRYTGYGPITAQPTGFTYFALRPRRDPGAIYLHKPGYRERLRPSKKLHFEIEVDLSTEPVLMSREQPTSESLLTREEHLTGDGLGATILRLGPEQTIDIPGASTTGGQYLIVLNGDGLINSMAVDRWSVGFIKPQDPAPAFTAGQSGAEILVVSFRKA